MRAADRGGKDSGLPLDVKSREYGATDGAFENNNSSKHNTNRFFVKNIIADREHSRCFNLYIIILCFPPCCSASFRRAGLLSRCKESEPYCKIPAAQITT